VSLGKTRPAPGFFSECETNAAAIAYGQHRCLTHGCEWRYCVAAGRTPGKNLAETHQRRQGYDYVVPDESRNPKDGAV